MLLPSKPLFHCSFPFCRILLSIADCQLMSCLVELEDAEHLFPLLNRAEISNIFRAGWVQLQFCVEHKEYIEAFFIRSGFVFVLNTPWTCYTYTLVDLLEYMTDPAIPNPNFERFRRIPSYKVWDIMDQISAEIASAVL